MADLFLKIVNMSISASWLVLAVVVLRFLLKKAPKWVNVLLWGVVALRLLFPFSIESALSLIPNRETISPEIMMDPSPEINSGVPALNSVVNPIITESFTPNPAASANPLQILIPIAAVIWIAGMVLMLAYTVFTYLRLRRRVRMAVRVEENIYLSEYVSSPFVLGLVKPRIYLPYHMNSQDSAHVIAHERTHIRRKDHWWKPLGFLLLTLHWFNPVMWLAYILLCRDIELACDEKVIRELGVDQRADYSQALLNCSVNHRMIAACPLAFGEVGVKQRVKNVLNYKKPAFWIILVAIIAVIVLVVCFVTDPISEDNVVEQILDKQLRVEETVYEYPALSSTVNPETAPIYTLSTNYILRSKARQTADSEPDSWKPLGTMAHTELTRKNFDAIFAEEFSVSGWLADMKPSKLRRENENAWVCASGMNSADAGYFLLQQKNGDIYLFEYNAESNVALRGYRLGEEDWGITLKTFGITSTGMAVDFELTDTTGGKYLYTNDYTLQTLTDGEWTDLERLNWQNESGEPTEKFDPALEKSFTVDWMWDYGELPEGHYRLGKTVTEAPDGDSRTVYAEFDIFEPYTITGGLRGENVGAVSVMFHGETEEEHYLPSGMTEELVAILNDLEEDEFRKPSEFYYDDVSGVAYDTSVVLFYEDGSIALYSDGESVEIDFVLYPGKGSGSRVVQNEALNAYIASLWDLDDLIAPLIGPVYEVTEILYEDHHYTGTYTVGVDAPIYAISKDGHLLAKGELDSGEEWADVGKFMVHSELTEKNFDPHFLDGFDAAPIRQNTQQVWELYTHNQRDGGDVLYYLLQQKNGDLLLAYVYPNIGYSQNLFLMKLEPSTEETAYYTGAQLQEGIQCVDIFSRKGQACLSSNEEVDTIMSVLGNIQENAQPVSENAYSDVLNDTWNNRSITINYEDRSQVLNLSQDCSVIWTENAEGEKSVYTIGDAGELQAYLTKMSDGVSGESTSGTPFATKEEPWKWAQNISDGAVEKATISVVHEVVSEGNKTSSRTSSGVMQSERFEEMLGILNAIPADSFKPGEVTSQYTYSTLRSIRGGRGVSVSIIDRVNSMAVVFRYTGDGVEMALIDDLEKVEDSSYKLKSLQMWEIDDPELRAFMRALLEHPPVVTYFVGSEYEWQEPIEYSQGAYSMSLRIIEDWEYEITEYSSDSQSFGVRCRPKAVSEGWLYFSFWPKGYEPQEENRYYAEGGWWDYPSVRSYPDNVATPTSVDVRHVVWSYCRARSDNGDFAVINEGADAWFLDYQDAIEDTVTLCMYSMSE